MGNDSIKRYYTETQFEYKLIWNWRLKTTPAFHFGFYDEKATNHGLAVFRANGALAEWGGVKDGDVIVDAGCGLGNSSVWLARNYEVNVVAITIVPKQVETIKKQLEKDPIPNMKVMVADYLHMPFEVSSVDVVWAMESVCHTQEKLDFYKEAYRVLRPGGRILMAEYIREGRGMSEDKEGLLHEVFDAWAIPDIDTLGEHEENAKRAGFGVFRSRDVSENVLPSYRNLRKVCNRYKWLSGTLHKTGMISTVRYNNFLSCSKQADALEQGVFRYYHIAAEK